MCLIKLKLGFRFGGTHLKLRLHIRFNKNKKELSFANSSSPQFFNYPLINQFSHKTHISEEKKNLLEEYQAFQNLNDSSRNREKIRRIAVHKPSSSLSSPPTSTVSTANQTSPSRMVACSSPSLLLLLLLHFLISSVLQSEQWRVSPLFMGQTGSDPNLNALDWVRHSKINKIIQNCFLKNHFLKNL